MNRLRDVYFLIANSTMLAMFVLVGLHVTVLWRNREAPIRFENLSEEIKANYRHLSPADVVDLLNATYKPAGAGWSYESWVGYHESERSSRFINVNKYGIRSSGKTRDEMSVLNGATWFFGGSTTFGYGVTDRETIPAQLEDHIHRAVVNLGRGYFFSAQENQFLRRLLALGYRPDRAVFLDGINERCDIENYQQEMSRLFTQATYDYRWNYAEVLKPLLYARDRLAFRLSAPAHQPSLSGEFSCEGYGTVTTLQNMLWANLRDRQLACSEYGVHCVTLVQPFPGLHGIHRDFSSLVQANRDLLKRKYDYLEPTWRRAEARFIVDAFDRFDQHAFVDDVHYSAAAARLVARRIADELEPCPARDCHTETSAADDGGAVPGMRPAAAGR